jgi:hypothetical protein
VRHALDARARCASELERQRLRELRAREELANRSHDAATRARELADIQARLALLRETALEAVTELQRRLSATRTAVRDGDSALQHELHALGNARDRNGRENQRCADAQLLLESRGAERKQAAERLQGFAATGLLALALPELEPPERSAWGVDASLNLALSAAGARPEPALRRVRGGWRVSASGSSGCSGASCFTRCERACGAGLPASRRRHRSRSRA